METNTPQRDNARQGWLAAAARRFRNTETGQSLVEFSMILPVFLILLFALVDFGRGFYTWMIVTEAAREGARAAAVQSDLNTVKSNLYASFCSSTYPDVSNCSIDASASTMVVTPTNIGGARGQETSIDITYHFSYVTPLGALLGLFGGSLSAPTITAHSSMRLE